jgi:hypothetical protein
MGTRWFGRLARVAAIAGLLLAALPAPVKAADITFGTPTATSTFQKGLDFSQPVDVGSSVDRVELLLTFPGATGPFLVEVPPPGTLGSTTLHYTWNVQDQGGLLPNTPVTARWRVRVAGSSDPLPPGPAVTITYADTRFTWRTATRGLVHVHWYQGDAAFGQRALGIATDAISTAEGVLGVTETRPTDFFVYADAQSFRDALGPSTGEFVVGRALPEIRTLFGLVSPNDIGGAEIGVTIAHELTHIVFDTATHNPYHLPPHWLNEGVAKYLSEGYGSTDRGLVTSAASDGTLYPLTSLASAFPTGQAVFLAYAEADAAIDYIVRTHGRDGLARLVDSYAAGRTDDEAFRSALGQDASGFDAAWFSSVGAKVPPPAGPSPAPPGPLPPGWGGGAVATQGPGNTGGGAVATRAPSATSGGSSAPAPGPGDGATAIGAGALTLVGVVVIVVAWRARRRPPAAVAPSWPGTGTGDTLGEDDSSDQSHP